eukprot:GEMP01106898.1.p1 GENE.GEMP01106898.1~~GEMP01106898.1.p1  ORF type:complete len:173 (+),score=7.83 GEMP01106898.1:169-687(+)
MGYYRTFFHQRPMSLIFYLKGREGSLGQIRSIRHASSLSPPNPPSIRRSLSLYHILSLRRALSLYYILSLRQPPLSPSHGTARAWMVTGRPTRIRRTLTDPPIDKILFINCQCGAPDNAQELQTRLAKNPCSSPTQVFVCCCHLQSLAKEKNLVGFERGTSRVAREQNQSVC